MNLRTKKFWLWFFILITLAFVATSLLVLFLIANITTTNIYNCSAKEKIGYISGSILSATSAILIIVTVCLIFDYCSIKAWIKNKMKSLNVETIGDFKTKYPNINIEQLFIKRTKQQKLNFIKAIDKELYDQKRQNDDAFSSSERSTLIDKNYFDYQNN